MEEEVRKDIADLSDKDLQKLLRKENPELLVMLPDLQKRLESLKVDVKPLVDSARKEPGELPNGHPISEVGTKIVDCKTQLHLNYCMMLLSYMFLKAENQDVKEHPVMPLLVKSRQVLILVLMAELFLINSKKLR